MGGLFLEAKIIFIYCLADTMIRPLKWKDGKRSKMTHAEIITKVMIFPLFYQCNDKLTRLVAVELQIIHISKLP